MDLTAKVAALEEEVNVLKGEIKLILQEVRTAILARENPFSLASTESLTLPASLREERGPTMERGTASPASPEPLPLAPVAVAAEPAIVKPARTPAKAPAVDLDTVRLDVPTLAALVTWTQETANLHSVADTLIVLSLARYSGLIEGDLEATLGKIAKNVSAQTNARAGIGDLLLALRQLEALIGSDASHGRKAS